MNQLNFTEDKKDAWAAVMASFQNHTLVCNSGMCPGFPANSRWPGFYTLDGNPVIARNGSSGGGGGYSNHRTDAAGGQWGTRAKSGHGDGACSSGSSAGRLRALTFYWRCHLGIPSHRQAASCHDCCQRIALDTHV